MTSHRDTAQTKDRSGFPAGMTTEEVIEKAEAN